MSVYRSRLLIAALAVAGLSSAAYLASSPGAHLATYEPVIDDAAFLVRHEPDDLRAKAAQLEHELDRVTLPPSPKVADNDSAKTFDPATDEHWQSLPITSFSAYPQKFYRPLAAFNIDRTFRNKRLNPRDLYIGAEDRDGLRAYAASEIEQIQRLEASLRNVAWEAVKNGIVEGVRKPLPLRQDQESLAAAALARTRNAPLTDLKYFESDGMDWIFSCGDRHYGFKWEELPGMADHHDVAIQLRLNFSVNLAAWYRDRHAMSGAELGTYIDESIALAEEKSK